jgi:hypothetical protein
MHGITGYFRFRNYTRVPTCNTRHAARYHRIPNLHHAPRPSHLQSKADSVDPQAPACRPSTHTNLHHIKLNITEPSIHFIELYGCARLRAKIFVEYIHEKQHHPHVRMHAWNITSLTSHVQHGVVTHRQQGTPSSDAIIQVYCFDNAKTSSSMSTSTWDIHQHLANAAIPSRWWTYNPMPLKSNTARRYDSNDDIDRIRQLRLQW